MPPSAQAMHPRPLGHVMAAMRGAPSGALGSLIPGLLTRA